MTYLRWAVCGGLVLGSGASAAGHQTLSYVAQQGTPQPALVWCDAPDAVLALTQPGDGFTGKLLSWPKTGSGLGPLRSQAVRINLTGPLAEAEFHETTWEGVTSRQAGGILRRSRDPRERINTFEFAHGGRAYACRQVPAAVFIGVTQRRTVIIWDSGRAATYATRNFDGSAGAYVTGGQVKYGGLGPEYTFSAANGYSYLVLYHEYSAFLQVSYRGKVLLTEPFVAYSLSRATKESP